LHSRILTEFHGNIIWYEFKNIILENITQSSIREEMLHQIAANYVNKGLGDKNFNAIPYAENVSLRAPLNPGGSEVPVTGRENLRNSWWKPLPDLIGKVQLIDTYINKDLSGVAAEFLCEIIDPACTLRIIDCFKVNEEGKITNQENFFDPRDVTNPGSK
jgi:hypothetical protein